MLDKLPANNNAFTVTPVQATSAMAFHRRLNKIAQTMLDKLPANNKRALKSLLYRRHQRWRSTDASTR
jgi:hypothetical protein